MSQTLKKGIQFALLAATISGFSIFYNKIVLVKGVDPLILNIVKNGGVAFILSLFLLNSKTNRMLLQKSVRKNFPKLLLIGVLGGSIPFLFFFEGLKLTTAINAAIIQKSLFIWVALLAIPLLKERLSKWHVIGYILILYSNLFIGGFSGLNFKTGEILILFATFFWTAEALLAKKYLKEIDALVLTWGRMFFGSLMLIVFALVQNKILLLTQLKAEYMLPLLGSIGFLTFYSVFYFKALSKAPATLVTATLILSTPITNILTAGILTHKILTQQLASTVITVLGIMILLLFLPKSKSQHAKEK